MIKLHNLISFNSTNPNIPTVHLLFQLLQNLNQLKLDDLFICKIYYFDTFLTALTGNSALVPKTSTNVLFSYTSGFS